MKMNRIWLLAVAALVGAVILNSTPTVAAEHEHMIKIGKKGDFTLSKETKVGDLTLKAGRYIFQHRVEGEDHFVRFTTPGGKDVGEVKCTVEPLPKKVGVTAFTLDTSGEVQRVTRIEVAGENVAHVF